MMNVQVTLKTRDQTTSKFEMKVNSEDTVGALKEKVAASQLIAFPEHSMMLDGAKMDEAKTLGEYGVKDSSSLDFILEASEKSINKQLTDLLRARDLTCDELGLLYCYKHGVSINQALKTIGIDAKFQDFVKDQKNLVVENNRVSLVRQDTTLKPFSVADQLSSLLKEHGPSMQIVDLCGKFVQKYHVSVASIVEMRPAEFLLQEKDKFVVSGSSVTLKGHEVAKTLNASQVQPQKQQIPAWRKEMTGQPKPEQQQQPWKSTTRPQVKVEKDDNLYQELHTKVSSRSFNSRIVQALQSITEVIQTNSFLNIASIEKGGSVAKGTALTGCSDAELVLMVRGLPSEGHSKWMAPMLRSVLATLQSNVSDASISNLELTEDSVRMNVKDTITVDVRISPAFESYSDTVQRLGSLGPNSRKFFESSFCKEQTQFVGKQPGHVKVAARLLKWWRDQQTWSCPLTRPSDYLLELVAIYVAQQCGKVDQAQMIANCMGLMSRFDRLRVVWSNFYEKSDVWSPLLMQTPLLMDPVNPFTNVADPQDFDSRELMAAASVTHFFW